MRKTHIIYNTLMMTLAVVLASFISSCSTDDPGENPSPENNGVELRLSVASPSIGGVSTRAAVTEEGEAGEFMKTWTIVAVQGNKIAAIYRSSDTDLSGRTNISPSVSTGEYSQSSFYASKSVLANGTYDFYTFANISDSELGLSADSKIGDTFDVADAFTVNGNQQNVSGFDANGIPMSNKQTVTITDDTNLIQLQVIRMVAKMRIQISNPTSDAIKVTRITLSDITKNTAGNIKLLPGELIADSTNGKRATHIAYASDTTTYVYSVPEGIQSIAANGGEQTYEFYVNESQARSDINHFVVGLTTDYSENGTAVSHRYAFADWNSIARNEIHVLPISLRRYRIDLYVRPYTAIGVLPDYDMESEIATINLGLYGHYDIVPRIRDLRENKYYHILNTTAAQGVTVQEGQTSETSDLTINSLELQNDNGIGTVYDIGGWDGNSDHYPTVGWNSTAMTPRIECITGNYTGWAIYTINASFTEKGSTTPINLTRRFRITNTYVDLSQLAKKRR